MYSRTIDGPGDPGFPSGPCVGRQTFKYWFDLMIQEIQETLLLMSLTNVCQVS